MGSPIEIATSSILLVLSALSFLPQIRKVLHHPDCERLSLYYILYNTLLATQNFSFGLFIQVGLLWGEIAPWPAGPTDWLNLLQHGVVWLGNLIILVLCLRLGPAGGPSKRSIIVIFSSFLFLTLVPAAVMTTLPKPPPHSNPMGDRRMYMAILVQVLETIHPIATGLGVCAFVLEARKLTAITGDLGALSLSGLLFQAVVFGLMTLSWLWRLCWPREALEDPVWDPVDLYWAWYKSIGWAAINNGIFAVGQGVLFALAWRAGHYGKELSALDERTPLL